MYRRKLFGNFPKKKKKRNGESTYKNALFRWMCRYSSNLCLLFVLFCVIFPPPSLKIYYEIKMLFFGLNIE